MSANSVQTQTQATWEAFCEELKQAGSQLIRDDLPLDELDAAEGLRYLSRMLRTGLERHVEGQDPRIPYLYALCDERIKGFGGDNPDTRYFGASINSEFDYCLSADFSHCTLVSIMATGQDENGVYSIAGSLDDASLLDIKKGPIEIYISNSESKNIHASKQLLSMNSHTQSLLIRCTFDNANEKDIELNLSRMGESDSTVQCQLDTMSDGLLDAAKFVRNTAKVWCNQSAGLRKNFNQLPLQDPERMRKMGGDPNIFYYSAAWSLAHDEALVIHIPTVPECKTWGLQINNIWTESLDYSQAAIHINKNTAHYDEDGGVTIVVSENDPLHANWLRTQGHRSGTANLRLMGASEPLTANTRVVKTAELKN